jgi:hypothetical protein
VALLRRLQPQLEIEVKLVALGNTEIGDRIGTTAVSEEKDIGL